jgi:hypothetical protein
MGRSFMRLSALCLSCLLWCSGARAQEPRPPDPTEIEKALQSGVQFLRRKYEKGFDTGKWNSTHELFVLALIHGGVSREDLVFQKAVRELETCPLDYTYRVSILAMALARLDARKYRARLAHCAQWLVDTQLADGDWSYPHWPPRPVAVAPPRIEKVEDAGGKPVVPIKIKRHRTTTTEKPQGDISNTQFAILGLRACLEAEIEIPRETWEDALQYYRRTQNADGGWGYCYGGARPKDSYASMTSAGVSSSLICRHSLQAQEPREDESIRKGLAWVGRNFRPDVNVNIEKRMALPNPWLYFYLYSIERLGKIAGVEKLGESPWYPAGARHLLKAQTPEGSWWAGMERSQWQWFGDCETTDTCFAMLFLASGTRPLTPTLGAGKK